MQRRILMSWVAAAGSMVGSGALAMGIASGGGATVQATAPVASVPVAPAPSVVIDRMFEDTFVVVGAMPPAAVAASRSSSVAAVRPNVPTTPDAVVAPRR